MSREIMQLALDALDIAQSLLEKSRHHDQILNAYKSLRQELAKPEQEFYPDWDMIKPFHERIAELEAQLAKPEQEPVAWRNAAIRLGEDLYSVGPNGYYDMTAKQWLDWALSVVNTAPPRKPWVGLTDDEVNLIYAEPQTHVGQYARAIEAKLRSKNT